MKTDRIVEAVRKKLKERSEVGQRKYGTTMERTDLSFDQWLQHAQEELMDGAVYLERIRRDSAYREMATLRIAARLLLVRLENEHTLHAATKEAMANLAGALRE